MYHETWYKLQGSHITRLQVSGKLITKLVIWNDGEKEIIPIGEHANGDIVSRDFKDLARIARQRLYDKFATLVFANDTEAVMQRYKELEASCKQLIHSLEQEQGSKSKRKENALWQNKTWETELDSQESL